MKKLISYADICELLKKIGYPFKPIDDINFEEVYKSMSEYNRAVINLRFYTPSGEHSETVVFNHTEFNFARKPLETSNDELTKFFRDIGVSFGKQWQQLLFKNHGKNYVDALNDDRKSLIYNAIFDYTENISKINQTGEIKEYWVNYYNTKKHEIVEKINKTYDDIINSTTDVDLHC